MITVIIAFKALNPKLMRKFGKTFLAIPGTPICTVFRRIHFKNQLVWNWLVRLRDKQAAEREVF